MILRTCALMLACAVQAAPVPQRAFTPFANPELVTIAGYSGDAMEPFLSRDGQILFFNNLNAANVNTNLFWARRVDDLNFNYQGEVGGIDTPALEAVASMDLDGHFYFVSNRSYAHTASTLYGGHFRDGTVTDVELVPGVSLARPGIVNFDAEISANGQTLFYVESQFGIFGGPKSARILVAHLRGNTFVRDPASESILRGVNAQGLNYAPATSASELELFFTRADKSGPAIYTATRPDRMQPFGDPVRLTALTGFVEAPTLSPDGRSLYFHRRQDGRFLIFRLTRTELDSHGQAVSR